MTGFLQQKTEENFDIEGAVADFIGSYYTQRSESGIIDESWQEIRKNNFPKENLGLEDQDEVIQKFTQTVPRGATDLKAGNVIAFDYTSLKGVRKSYFVVIVATKRGGGFYSNLNTRHTLMTSFLIHPGTNLNTLALVVEVINSEKIKQKRKSYKGLVNPYDNRALRRKTGVSQEGMGALFSTTEFRTFCVDVGMGSVYKITLDG